MLLFSDCSIVLYTIINQPYPPYPLQGFVVSSAERRILQDEPLPLGKCLALKVIVSVTLSPSKKDEGSRGGTGLTLY